MGSNWAPQPAAVQAVSAPALPLEPPAPAYRRLPRLQELGLLIVIVLLGLVITLASDPVVIRGQKVNNFLRVDNLVPSVLTPMAWMAVMSIGVTCVIIAGGIDISVGSIWALAALATAWVLLKFKPEAPAWQVLPVAFVVPLAVGLVCGLINGLLVVGLRMHPFIVTLATMSIFRGIALVAVPTKALPAGTDETLPIAYTKLMMWKYVFARGGKEMFVQPVPVVVMLICLVLFWVYLGMTIWGRENYAVGGNEEAARFSGLRVWIIKLRVYALSGLCAGVAGMLSTGYYASWTTQVGNGAELMVVAAAVVGGASLTGGRGTALGAVLGTLVIQLIENGIYILKKINLGIVVVPLSKEYTKIIVGVSILLAVAVDQLSEHLQARRMRRSTRH